MIIASLKGKIFKKLHNLVYDDGEMVNAKIPSCRINMTETISLISSEVLNAATISQ